MFNENTKTDNEIIDYLSKANYMADLVNAYRIAVKTNNSYSNVLFRLRIMRDKGIIIKTTQGVYSLTNEAKENWEYFKVKKEQEVKTLLDRAAIIYEKREKELNLEQHAANHARIIRKKANMPMTTNDVMDHIKMSLMTKGSDENAESKGTNGSKS